MAEDRRTQPQRRRRQIRDAFRRMREERRRRRGRTSLEKPTRLQHLYDIGQEDNKREPQE